MTTSPNLPKLYGRTLENLLDWAERIVVYFEQEVSDALATGDAPVGTVLDWATASASAPSGWLLCDGSAVAIVSYPQLYSLLGTDYNTGGEPADTFRVPNETVTIAGVAGRKRIIRHD